MPIRVPGGTYTTLIRAVRDELTDPAVDREGVTVPAVQRTWSDDQITGALTYAQILLDMKLQIAHPGDAIVSVDGTYDANGVSSALPAGIGAYDRIVKVEDITKVATPAEIPYVTPTEIERYSTPAVGTLMYPASYRCTLVDSADFTRQLQIRPRPRAALRIRVYYMAAPRVSDTNETVALSALWGELLVLDAAMKLLSRKGEQTDQQQARYAQLMDQFTQASRRQRMPMRVRRARRGVS